MRMAMILVTLGSMGCSGGVEGDRVRVTLDDSQVMVGDVWTHELSLEGALGVIAIPLEDVGEVVPVEGHDLESSNGHVTVWLRNGTELRGRWTEPQLRMGLTVGDEVVDVDLPMDQVQRFQTPGAEQWPTSAVFRVRTNHGDDLLVDPENTQITIRNALGTFSPYLTECRSLAPIGAPDGDWRVVLENGTVLVGPLQHEVFELAMPMGPEAIEVPVVNVLSLTWQDWGTQSDYSFSMPVEKAAEEGWFYNDRLRKAKE